MIEPTYDETGNQVGDYRLLFTELFPPNPHETLAEYIVRLQPHVTNAHGPNWRAVVPDIADAFAQWQDQSGN